MRALLVVNPMATTTTRRGRDILIRALGSELKLDVEQTRYRGHAIDLARQAALDGFDVVVALGGDGTVNEVVNGLLADGPRADSPALAVVPGGSANVFARTIGLSRSPVEATSEILDSLRAGRSRRLGLGHVVHDGEARWFTFCAGLGLDAEVVRRVERRRRSQPATTGLYVRQAVAHFFTGTDRRHPALTLERPDAEPVDHLFLGIVSNTSPWTYLGDRPVDVNPGASYDRGLDLLAMRRLGTASALRTVRQILREPGDPHGRQLLRVADLERFSLVAGRPLAMQVDGDYLGERERAEFTAVPHALRVVC